MEHTTGKLTFRGFSIYAADGKTPVADTCLNASVAQHDVANARRLVACWNACDGIPTKWLEGGAADILEYSKALKAQRDELLAALERMCELYAPTTVARALIAKHSNKGAATKPEPEYNPLFIDGVQHDPLCLKVYRSPLKECDCGAAAKHKGAEHG